MSIQKTSYIERVLIALHPDGSIKGAHQESLLVVKDGETVLSTTQLGAVGLTAEALALALPTQGALLAQLAAVTAERDSLLTATPTPPVAPPAPVEAPAAPPVVKEPVAVVVVEEPTPAPVVEEPVVATLEADPAAP